jgi:hypothetical protein
MDANELRYDRAVAVWIARRTGCDDPSRIQNIIFEHEDGQQIGDYTWDSGGSYIAYQLLAKPRRNQKAPVTRGTSERISIEYLAPSQLIREVLAVLDDPDAQQWLGPVCSTCNKPVGDVLTSSVHDRCLGS